MPIPQNQIKCVEIHITGQMTAKGSNAINTDFVFHYRRITLAVAPNKTNIQSAFTAAVGTPIYAALNASWSASALRLRFPDDAQDQFQDFANANVGAITGDRMASEDAAYLTFKTSLRGKNYRGGKHLAPMSESDSTSGTEDLFNAACLTRLAAINTGLLAGLTDSDGNQWVFAILSRNLSQLTVNPTTVVINDVTEARVNKRIGSMLRRKAKSVY